MDLLSKLLFILNLISAQPDNFTSVSPFRSLYGFSPRRSLKDILLATSGCANESAPPAAKPANSTLNLTVSENPSTGNCTNNLTNPRSITDSSLPPEIEAPPDEPSKQPIVTFDEWTKEKLKQEQKKMVPPVVTAPAPVVDTPTPTRNYASRECGAKVIMANAEAENTKAILNDKEKDEYMRNPCIKAENKFIVLELCETVQPRQIVIGNFELFSSGPKDIRVLTAERPGADWQPLGNFTATDTRQLQTFNIESRQYAKLLKIELLSHYGSEHYCTLSVLKVMGSSMVDEYEYEANQAETVRLPVQSDSTETLTSTPPAAVNLPPPTLASTTPQPPVATIPEPPTVVEPVTTPPPKTESKPMVREIVDQVVSGKILKNIVNVVATKLSGEKKESKVKKYKPFDMALCQVCPVKPSCIVPTHLCWVFVWRPPLKNSTIPVGSLVLPNRRWFSERRRRRSIAFHQRQLYERRDFVVPIEIGVPTEKPAASNIDVVTEESATEELVLPVSPTAPPVTDAIPAASVSHKESIFMKLNKRIAALELNMSLSSEYLSELSRQYVAQTDEHKKHLDQARKAAQEVAENVESRLNKTISERLSLMRQEMDSLTQWLHSIRTAATELSLSRYVYQMPDKDSCRSEDITAVKHYVGTKTKPFFGAWSVEEIVSTLIATQIITIIIFCGIVSYICSKRPAAVGSSELEKLVQTKLEEVLKKCNSNTVEVVEPLIDITKKKRRRRNRPVNPEYASSDSAVSRITSCQTETSSEAESARLAAQQILDITLVPPSPEEKSEEEQPWIPVRRKNSLK